MGYPKKCLHPAIMAASASASLPFINTFAILSYLSTVIATSGHIIAQDAQPVHFD
jgi:hypothetical protein